MRVASCYRAFVASTISPVGLGGELPAEDGRGAVEEGLAHAQHPARRVVHRKRVVDDLVVGHTNEVMDPHREEAEPRGRAGAEEEEERM